MSVHPSFNEFLKEFHASPDFCDLTPEENRQRLNDMYEPPQYSTPLADVLIEDRHISTDGALLPIRIYRSQNSSGSGLVWIHGGGFVLGDLNSNDLFCRMLTVKTGRAVISIHYRLAPEFPFPTSVDDCFSLCEWIFSHTKQLKIQENDIAIGGASAGATLATVVCLMRRDKKMKLNFQHQLLVMPLVDNRMDYPSYTQYGDHHMLTAKSIRYFLNHYTNHSIEALENPYCFPIYAKNVSDLPPAIIAVAECDPLHDEGVLYANKLKKAGNQVKLLELEGVFHGFMSQIPNNPYAEKMANKIINLMPSSAFLNKALK